MGFESAPAPPEVWEPNPLCSEEQLKVLEEVRQGKKVFFTGSAGAFLSSSPRLQAESSPVLGFAGVGKSFLLSEYLPSSLNP